MNHSTCCAQLLSAQLHWVDLIIINICFQCGWIFSIFIICPVMFMVIRIHAWQRECMHRRLYKCRCQFLQTLECDPVTDCSTLLWFHWATIEYNIYLLWSHWLFTRHFDLTKKSSVKSYNSVTVWSWPRWG